MKQRCKLLKLKAFLAFVSSKLYAQMYANHTLKDFIILKKFRCKFINYSTNENNRSEYCELFLRNSFFLSFSSTQFLQLGRDLLWSILQLLSSFFSICLQFCGRCCYCSAVLCCAVWCGINAIRIQKFKPKSNSHEIGTCFTYFADF